MEFNLFNFGKTKNDFWIDLFLIKFKHWEPGLFRLHNSYGKWDWDLFGIGEIKHWWKMRR